MHKSAGNAPFAVMNPLELVDTFAKLREEQGGV
jgi:hypothetical protein